MTERINIIESSVITLEKEVNSLEGQLSLLKEQNKKSIEKCQVLKELSVLNIKAIELLNFVQKATKEVIKNIFENTVTKALQFIHQSNEYGFELDFGQRGNIPELNFKILTPSMKNAHDIIDTNGGGTMDIVSLALRLVLLEVSKTNGLLFLDEPEKHLDSPETLKKMIEFVKEIQTSSARQIMWITHKEEVVDSVQNPIFIINKKEIRTEPKPKKKSRGRQKIMEKGMNKLDIKKELE